MEQKIKHNEYLIYEDEQFYLYLGNPKLKYSTKINVTIAVKIGIGIGSGDYKEIEYSKI